MNVIMLIPTVVLGTQMQAVLVRITNVVNSAKGERCCAIFEKIGDRRDVRGELSGTVRPCELPSRIYANRAYRRV